LPTLCLYCRISHFLFLTYFSLGIFSLSACCSCPNELIKSSKLSSSSWSSASAAAISSAVKVPFVFCSAGIASVEVELAFAVLVASQPLPNLARKAARRPASSSSTARSLWLEGFQSGELRVSRLERYTGKGEVVRCMKVLPSERVTSCVNV